jgi:hypothetical protein
VVLHGLASDRGISDGAAERSTPYTGQGRLGTRPSRLSGPKVRCALVSGDFYSYFVRFLVAVWWLFVAALCAFACDNMQPGALRIIFILFDLCDIKQQLATPCKSAKN